MPNGIGTIDSDYRGELMVLATWIGEGDELIIDKGERVAQLLFSRVPKVKFVERKLEELGNTVRGEGFWLIGKILAFVLSTNKDKCHID